MVRDPNKPYGKLKLAQTAVGTYKTVLLAEQKRSRVLAALLFEVVGRRGTYTGADGANRGLMLFSRLAEIGWFKRARAAIKPFHKNV